MLLRTHTASLELPANQVLSLCDARGVELHVTRGKLWITEQDDPRDRVVQAGDSLTIGRDGCTVVSAVAGRASLVATQPRHTSTRIGLAVLLKFFRAQLRWGRLQRYPVAALRAA